MTRQVFRLKPSTIVFSDTPAVEMPTIEVSDAAGRRWLPPIIICAAHI